MINQNRSCLSVSLNLKDNDTMLGQHQLTEYKISAHSSWQKTRALEKNLKKTLARPFQELISSMKSLLEHENSQIYVTCNFSILNI
jgi:hypothetical protein